MGQPSSLRDRFHDWCSAVIVERLAMLSADEVYRRSRPPESQPWGERETADSVHGAALELLAVLPSQGAEADERFRRLIVSLLEEVPLPSFEEWTEAYVRDPEPYDGVILGFAQETETQGAVGA